MAKNLKQQYSQIVKLFNSMIGAHQLWELWEDAMTIFALMISNAIDKRFFDQREKEYMNLASKYSDSELQTFLKIFAEIVNQLKADPEQDLLGDLYMSLDLGSHWHGQFFTPYNVCAMMAQAQMPLEMVSKMLGHENLATTQIYLDLTEEELEAAHKKYVI